MKSSGSLTLCLGVAMILLCLLKPKLQILVLVMFFWGEIMSSDQKQVIRTTGRLAEQTEESKDTLEELVDNVRNGTAFVDIIREGLDVKTADLDYINMKNSTSGSEKKKTKFQPMISVFLIELILVLFSNLSTLMIRSYKNSIPLVKLNMIILISYYVVELANFILICQVWHSKLLNPKFKGSARKK